ncbi:alginate lyase family protein [Paenibacillus sp. BSR1-1]|uniref:alginate lyase family protein n=1 Tax=Paenibacillus sp. BSR1-1 TaxID=3020845 RepID=UPI0025B1D5EA|nr:alginate lyase family protein [Paenibacillus sp. BSR1-1]MDN3019177.1 alginate lyase family protein [Paenibacillus sp. BSR1-1]
MGELQQKINKLRNMPVKVITRKIGQKLSDNTYHIIRKNIIKFMPVDIDVELFVNFEPEFKFMFNPLEKDYYRNKLIEFNLERQIIDEANKICKHQFNLLGSGDVNLGKEIPWNKDFKVDFVWENNYYKDINIVDLTNNADVKVPWELSRFQHIFSLGKAYWITKNEKYAEEFKEQIKDWIIKNPIEMSVNWTCAMDVAIRAVNWITGYFFFKDSKVINKRFWLDFNKSLYLHGKYIYRNLENKDEYTGNHYLSNIVGLVWLGLYFGKFQISKIIGRNNPEHWLNFGLNELEKEMNVQVNNDGTNYEASTSYHRLVTELFLITTVFCCKNNIEFSNEYLNRLEKMCEFMMHLTQPNGKSPIIGDADDGRLIIFSNYGTWLKDDFRHLLSVGGVFFNREDFMYMGSNYKEDSLWVTGQWHNKINAPFLKSNSFADAGYYILRNSRIYCCIRCGENSFRGEGVHSHNDQLSFTLNVDGNDIFIDPGAFIYTSDYKMRNLFRSTTMHNTIEIPKFEQNDFNENILFFMKEQTFSECKDFNSNQFVGNHKGYLNKCGLIHERNINIYSNSLIILDYLLGDVIIPKYKVNFVLAPDVSVDIENNNILLYKGNIKIKIIFKDATLVKLEDIFISNSYGIKRKSKKIVAEGSTVLFNTQIIFD